MCCVPPPHIVDSLIVLVVFVLLFYSFLHMLAKGELKQQFFVCSFFPNDIEILFFTDDFGVYLHILSSSDTPCRMASTSCKRDDPNGDVSNVQRIDQLTSQSELADFLSSAIESYEHKMHKWLCAFGWTEESLLDRHQSTSASGDTSETLTCPFNSGHARIQRANYERHVNKCRLKQLGYSNLEIVKILNVSILP